MSETIGPQEAAELRRRLDQVAPAGPLLGLPLDHPLPPPGSWERQQMDKQEAQRQERLAASKAALEQTRAEERGAAEAHAAAAEAERQRKARNAPFVAELDKKIEELQARRAEEYWRHVVPIDEQLAQLSNEREALE
jgi:hypothetical protein